MGIAALLLAPLAAAQVTLYEWDGLRGQVFTADRPITDLTRYGFNDRASSMIVQRGQWEVCEHQNYQGECRILRPGQYPSLAAMGLNNKISSFRRVDGKPSHAYAPPPPVASPYPYYLQHGETLYTADVVAVRAVMGPPEQRCWVEQQQVVTNSGPERAGRDHRRRIGRRARPPDWQRSWQRRRHGSGRGRRRGHRRQREQGRQPGRYAERAKCTSVPGSAQPQYWDVTYVFRGVQHRAQLNFAPGATITVNANGEPRA